MKKKHLYILLSVLFVGCSASEENGNSAKVKEYFQQGNKLYKAGKYTKAIALYNKAIRLDPGNAMVYLKRGDSQRKLRRSKAAIIDYNKVINLRPSNARAFFHRGTLKIKLGQKNKGCEDVQKAKALCYVPAEKFYSLHCN